MSPPQSLFLDESGLQRLLYGGQDGVGKTLRAAATALRLVNGKPQSALFLAELSVLYMRLEAGQISESEFAEREIELRDQLDQLQAQETGPSQSAEEKARRVEPANAY